MQIFGGWGKSTSTSGAAAGAPSAIVTTSSGHVSSNAPADQGVSDAEVAKIFKRDIKSFAESSGLPMKTPDQKKIVGAMFMKFIDEKRRDAAIAQQSKYVQGAHNLAQDAQDLATFQFKEVLAAQTLLCEMRDERNAQRRLAQQPSALDINEACAETPAEYAEMLLARHFQDELVDAEVFLDGVIDQLKTQSLPEHGLEIAAEGEACRTLLKSGNPEKIDEAADRTRDLVLDLGDLGVESTRGLVVLKSFKATLLKTMREYYDSHFDTFAAKLEAAEQKPERVAATTKALVAHVAATAKSDVAIIAAKERVQRDEEKLTISKRALLDLARCRVLACVVAGPATRCIERPMTRLMKRPTPTDAAPPCTGAGARGARADHDRRRGRRRRNCRGRRRQRRGRRAHVHLKPNGRGGRAHRRRRGRRPTRTRVQPHFQASGRAAKPKVPASSLHCPSPKPVRRPPQSPMST